jgi:uncharacterized protein YdbL (DUF1318 family)
LRCTAISGALLFAVAGCTGIGVNLTSDKPINVDINMKLDVYQHGDSSVQKKLTAAPSEPPVDVQMRRKNRMGEIQVLKNSRIVGENHLGLLEIRGDVPGEYGSYVKETLDAENKDRMEIMQQTAKQENLPLEKVQAQQADLAFKRAFSGEWIETAQSDGSSKWEQKGQEK